MSNLQPNCCLEFDFQKVDQHAGGKWLIHDTKRRIELAYFPKTPWYSWIVELTKTLFPALKMEVNIRAFL